MLEKISEIILNVERMRGLIAAGKDSIYYSVLEGDFDKAKRTAEEVTAKQRELRDYQESLVETKG